MYDMIMELEKNSRIRQSKKGKKNGVRGRIADSSLFVCLNVNKKYQNCGNKDIKCISKAHH